MFESCNSTINIENMKPTKKQPEKIGNKPKPANSTRATEAADPLKLATKSRTIKTKQNTRTVQGTLDSWTKDSGKKEVVVVNGQLKGKLDELPRRILRRQQNVKVEPEVNEVSPLFVTFLTIILKCLQLHCGNLTDNRHIFSSLLNSCIFGAFRQKCQCATISRKPKQPFWSQRKHEKEPSQPHPNQINNNSSDSCAIIVICNFPATYGCKSI